MLAAQVMQEVQKHAVEPNECLVVLHHGEVQDAFANAYPRVACLQPNVKLLLLLL